MFHLFTFHAYISQTLLHRKASSVQCRYLHSSSYPRLIARHTGKLIDKTASQQTTHLNPLHCVYFHSIKHTETYTAAHLLLCATVPRPRSQSRSTFELEQARFRAHLSLGLRPALNPAIHNHISIPPQAPTMWFRAAAPTPECSPAQQPRTHRYAKACRCAHKHARHIAYRCSQ